eukprot:TRINITY_DN9378_c0_g1_i2.p1 TRINITY_DN9378_c0_g1~~TRINITY_DN9378_c0_g1_i2.p1  ORF type:complete len:214 (-),score=46.80 TRINITY_DN9378_c0_g1_i2:396-1037(-)
MKKSLLAWLCYHQKVQKTKREANLAENFSKSHVLSKVLALWKEANSLRRQKKMEEMIQIENAQKSLSELKLKRCVCRWRAFTIRSMELKEIVVHVESLHTLSLKRQVIESWRKRLEISQQKRILLERAINFRNENLMKKCLSKWEEKVERRKLKQEKENRSLIFWFSHTSSKVFECWAAFIARRKEKAQEEQSMLELHKIFLLRDTIRKWIVV